MTEQQPLVSIVIPCYNHAQFVQESIQSVIDQDYENIELIIIDDGSKDNSVEVIQEMIPACEERFVRFEFRYRPNKGLSATLNEALKWCEGVYFSALASDDIIRPYKISWQVPILNLHPEYSGVFGGIEVIYKDGTKSEAIKSSEVYDFEKIFKHKHILPAPTQLLRLDNVIKAGGFRADFIIEDWIMWLDLTKTGDKLLRDERIVASYRRHDSNLSGQLDKMFQGRIQILEVFKDNEHYKKAKARVYFIQGIETQVFSKMKSLPLIFKAILLNPLIIFSKSFLGYIAKFLIKRKSYFK